MEKIDIMKTIVSVIVIILLAVFIVNINKLVSPKVQNIVEEPITPITSGVVTDYGKCFSRYGESSTTIVFVHSNYCPHCRSMIPIIEEMEKGGYKFYFAESSDSEAREIVSNCFSNLLSGYVPQFICPKTGKEQTGGMSKADLKKFADDCS